MKVLLADDDRDQLTVRGMLLRKNGFETALAGDRDSALRVAAADSPDCAVIDLRMPGEDDGLGLIRELRSAHRHLPIFVLTGSNPVRLAQKKEWALVQGVIKKGSSSSDLIQKLKALEKRMPRL